MTFDSNGDGRVDLLVAGAPLQLVLGKAAGFDPPVSLGYFGRYGSVSAVGAADLDGDHLPDIVVAGDNQEPSVGHELTVLQRLPSGSYQGVAYDCLWPPAFAIGDVNRDGMNDILTPTCLYLNRTNETPIQVAELTAMADGRRVILTWMLDDAERTTGVEVERAFAGSGPFNRVTRTPLVPHQSMRFEDLVPEPNQATAWYRIRLLHPDGTQTFSATVSVQLGAGASHSRIQSVVGRESGGRRDSLRDRSHSVSSDMNIYDVRGRRVAQVSSGLQAPGSHVLVWSAHRTLERPLARGVYWLVLQTGGRRESRAFVYLHGGRD
jgi:hypothetical protein